MERHLNISVMQKSAFVLRQIRGISYYSCRAFDELPDLCHGFSTRLGEDSLNLGYTAWDSAKRVDANRRRFLSALRLHEADLATLHQVHSNHVHIVREISGQSNQAEGDALITQVEGIALAVQIADCLPVLIADPVRKVVAAVHSGWRGTLKRIAAITIEEMQRAFGSDPAQLVVAVGPGIRACCYEIGSDVAARFDQEYPGYGLAQSIPGREGQYLLDLPKALDIQFHAAGIRSENSFDLNACTRCNTGEFFSYRAEGTSAGRMMAVIGRRCSI
jgi:YfiH family protein